MSFYDDYVADGACCQCCGAYMGDEPGYARFCDGCKGPPDSPKSTKAKVATAIAKDKVRQFRNLKGGEK